MDDLKHLKAIIKDLLQEMTAQEINGMVKSFIADLPQEEKNAIEILLAEELLLAQGWEKIEQSQWAKPDDSVPATESAEKTPQTELPPPWVKYPSIPCYSIGWRMGVGEEYMREWWFNPIFSGKDSSVRVDYFKKYLPLPFSWLVWIADSCGYCNNDRSEQGIFIAVRQLEEEGLADFNEFKIWADTEKKARQDAKNKNL
jgi:hypothetical protein